MTIKKTDLNIKEISEEQLQNISGGCITCCVLGLLSGCARAYYTNLLVRQNHDIAQQQFQQIINNAHQPQNNHPQHIEFDVNEGNPNHIAIPMPEGGANIDLNN